MAFSFAPGVDRVTLRAMLDKPQCNPGEAIATAAARIFLCRPSLKDRYELVIPNLHAGRKSERHTEHHAEHVKRPSISCRHIGCRRPSHRSVAGAKPRE